MPSGSARTGSLVTTSAFPPSGWSAPTTRACTSTHPGRTSRSASAHRAAASCPELADHLAGVKRARAPKRLKLCYSFVLRTLAYMVLLSRGLQFRHPHLNTSFATRLMWDASAREHGFESARRSHARHDPW